MLALLLALVAVLASLTDALRSDGDGAARTGAPQIQRVRERLRARPHEERARLERHLAEFERLTPAARARLLERARALRSRERDVAELRPRGPNGPRDVADRDVADRDDPDRDGTDRLSAGTVGAGRVEADRRDAERVAAERRELRERIRERGRELRDRLPESIRRRLEAAPPAERPALLERIVQRREQASLRVLADLRRRGVLDEKELRRFERMPLADRLQALRELHARSRGAPRAPAQR